MSEDELLSLAPRSSASESLREKLMLALVGFILTGVLGGVLTTWIQQRGWVWQNRVANVDKDISNVVATNKATSELLNGRWFAAYRLVRALERKETGPIWTETQNEYRAADREWALHYANVARDADFYVDTPFGIDGTPDLKSVWTYVCKGGTTSASVPTEAARVILELINHCHDELKNDLDKVVDPSPTIAHVDEKQLKAILDRSYRRLDEIYRTNDVLRCVMFDRATAIRNAASAQSYWSSFFGIDSSHYQISRRVKDCAP